MICCLGFVPARYNNHGEVRGLVGHRYRVVLSILALALITFSTPGKAENLDAVHEETGFTLQNSYALTLVNGSSMSFSFEVSKAGASGRFQSSPLRFRLEHNYDVKLQLAGTSFRMKEGDYNIPASWTFKWVRAASSPVSWPDGTTVTATGSDEAQRGIPAEVVPNKDLWLEVSVGVDRSGLDDPAGSYRANVDVRVVELGN